MLVKVVAVIALVIGLLLLLRWFRRASPSTVSALLKRSALIGGAIVLVVLAATGRLHWLFAVIGGLLPFAQRALGLLRSYQTFRQVFSQIPGLGGSRAGAAKAQTSKIETRYLRMALDHQSGELTGTLLAGRYQGRRLSELDLEALLEVLAECRVADEESAPLLEAYLDRRFGPQWQAQQPAGGAERRAGAAGSGKMTRQEAREILGLQEGASAEEIRDAHRRLMQKMHPDRGGSTYLAAKINQAKDVLLG